MVHYSAASVGLHPSTFVLLLALLIASVDLIQTQILQSSVLGKDDQYLQGVLNL